MLTAPARSSKCGSPWTRPIETQWAKWTNALRLHTPKALKVPQETCSFEYGYRFCPYRLPLPMLTATARISRCGSRGTRPIKPGELSERTRSDFTHKKHQRCIEKHGGVAYGYGSCLLAHNVFWFVTKHWVWAKSESK